MRKLFSLICGLFVLYSTLVVQTSATIDCKLTRSSPSMISATIIDAASQSFSSQMASITVSLQKLGDFNYDMDHCYLRANRSTQVRTVKEEQDNTYKIEVSKSTMSSPTVNFSGKVRLAPNAVLGIMEIDCPLIAPNLLIDQFDMSVSIEVGTKKFTTSSNQCQSLPYTGLATAVSVTTPLVPGEQFVLKLENLTYALMKGVYLQVSMMNTKYFDKSFDTTFGTQSALSINTTSTQSGLWCHVNDVASKAFISRLSSEIVRIEITDSIPSKDSYTIKCPNTFATIKKGNAFSPGLVLVRHSVSGKISIGSTTYIH